MRATFPSPSAVIEAAADGTQVVLIESGGSGSFAAALSYGVGYGHDRLRRGSDEELPLVPGLVHLAEHVFARSHHETLLEFEKRGTLNPRTTADSIVWMLRGDHETSQSVIDALAAALKLIGSRLDAHTIRKAIRHELPIIAAEHAYRSSVERTGRVALQAGLFPGVNLGRDSLGDVEELADTSLVDVAAVLSALGATLESVIIVAPSIDGDLAARVVAVVQQAIGRRPDVPWTATADDPESLPPAPATVLDDWRPGSAAGDDPLIRGWFGFRLRPVDRIAASRRVASVLLGEALRRRGIPRSQVTRRSRSIGGGVIFETAWTDKGAAPFAIAEFRGKLRRTIRRMTLTPDAFANWVEMALLSREKAVDKLGMAIRCHKFGVRLGEVLELGMRVEPVVVEELLDELQTAPGTVVYRGPELA